MIFKLRFMIKEVLLMVSAMIIVNLNLYVGLFLNYELRYSLNRKKQARQQS